ncbi:polysaccharide deacetylase family protein [Candidatus Sumerlaeota bacterium]|nr:polysaccharide deacetylase family protein [Candidatus Sumerlaeota bacterium]
MKASVFYSNERFSSHIRYVFHHIAEYAGISQLSFFSYEDLKNVIPENIIITYGDAPPRFLEPHIHIHEAHLFSEKYLDPSSLPALPLPRWNDLPVLFGNNPENKSWVEKIDKLIISRIDLVAGIFFLLTRYEESVITSRDQYGRFPATASILSQGKILETPLADEYADVLRNWMRELVPSMEKKNAPNRFSLYVTHDVDAPFKYTWRNVLGLRKPFIRGMSVLTGKTRDPWWTFPELLKIDGDFGIRADYFFLAGGKRPLDRGYSLSQKRILDLIKTLKESGCGIGIHFSLESHLSLMKYPDSSIAGKAFIQEHALFVEKIRQFPKGSRQHFLAVSVPETWRQLDKLDIPFDASVGFAEAPGFRCGTCRAFQCFDSKRGEILKLREIPLVAMDATFLHYLKCSPREALDKLKRLALVVEKHQGVFSLLWHNNTICEGDYPGWRERYIDFLKFCRERNAVMDTVHPSHIQKADT